MLAGPLLRRVTATEVTVFMALKEARKATLRIREGGSTGAVRATGTRSTVALGTNFHVLAISATGALQPGTTYAYDIAFGAADGNDAAPVTATTQTLLSAGVVHTDAAVARTRLVYAEAGAPDLPSFALPPTTPADLRIVHASCRKPHAQGDDALRAADEMVRTTVATPAHRPHLLMLTGDQIYADDVADVLCAVVTDAAPALLGWDEQLPTAPPADRRIASVFTPGQRGSIVNGEARLTTEDGGSHLLSFGEFCAMYLLAWGEAIWPETLPTTADFDDPAFFRDMTRNEQRRAVARYWIALPAVRRALANIPTLMAFDDHEITDDWNLRGNWTREVLDPTAGAPLGRRIVQNGLAAFAVFQAWGNTPEQFAPAGAAGAPGRALLAALRDWRGDDATAAQATAIGTAVGMPTSVDADGVALAAPGALRWHYDLTLPSFQLLVLDTRTRRSSPGGGDRPAALLGAPGALQDQLRDVPLPAADVPVLVAAATPVFGNPFMEWLVSVGSSLGKALARKFDAETWQLQPAARERFLSALVTRGAPGTDGVKRRRVVVLCGDVHYGFSTSAKYSASLTPDGAPDGVIAALAQLTASPAKNEDWKTHLLHGTGFAFFSDSLPRETVVGFANLGGGEVVVGSAPGSGSITLRGTPAFIKLPDGTVPAANVDWRYDVEFLLADTDSDVNRGAPPVRVPAPPPGNRDAALSAYLSAARSHADDYVGKFGVGKEIVGCNCIGELTFEWGETDDSKAVVHELWWALKGEPSAFPLSRWRVSLANGSAAGAGIRLSVQDAAGNAVPLANAWVYVRDAGGALTTLRTEADGRLMRTAGAVRDAPWDYDEAWSATAGAAVRLAFTRGARPVPEAVLARPALVGAFVAATVPVLDAQGRAQLAVRGLRVDVTRPADLDLWPLLWQAPDAPMPWLAGAGIDPAGRTYEKAGLPQRSNAYNNPGVAAGVLNVADGTPAGVPPAGAELRVRGLAVDATVDAVVTAVTVELLDRTGAVIPTRETFLPTSPRRDATPATLVAPVAGRRAARATVILDRDAVAAALGHVQVLLICETPDGPRIEAAAALLTGVQAALVEDPAPGARGAPRGEGDDVRVVDFGAGEQPDGTSTPASPATTPGALADTVRVRRMVRYGTRVVEAQFDPLAPADPVANPVIPKPAMPLLMAELHLAGADHAALTDLMRRRWHRRGPAAAGATLPLLQLDLELTWRLQLSWNGGDAAAATVANYPRPLIHHEHVTALADATTVALRFGEDGELRADDGDPLALVDGDSVPGAIAVPALPAWMDAGRRVPTVRVDQQRIWGRAGGAAAPATVIEWLPLQQAIRGGDGQLEVTALRVGREGVAPVAVDGGILPAAAPANAAPAPANLAPARLPRFRVVGTNPVQPRLLTLVERLVDRRLPGMRGRPEVDALADSCWRATFAEIVRHESGAHGQYYPSDPGRQPYTSPAGNHYFVSLERGTPTFGPPHGYGLGQLDNFGVPVRGANDDEIWDFVANVLAMLAIVFDEKAPGAFGKLDDHMPAPTDQRWRAAYQREVVRRYNGGREMEFSGGQWRIDPSDVPPANINYPNEVLGPNVNYADPRPIAFTAAMFGPGTADVP